MTERSLIIIALLIIGICAAATLRYYHLADEGLVRSLRQIGEVTK